jgi:MoxR-like ATPase
VLECDVKPVISLEEFSRLRLALRDVAFKPDLLQYLVDLVRKTRTHENIFLGAGPRATQAIVLASRAYAVSEMRDFVTPDDIRAVAGPVFEHRLVLRPEAEVEGIKTAEVLADILREVPVPR